MVNYDWLYITFTFIITFFFFFTIYSMLHQSCDNVHWIQADSLTSCNWLFVILILIHHFFPAAYSVPHQNCDNMHGTQVGSLTNCNWYFVIFTLIYNFSFHHFYYAASELGQSCGTKILKAFFFLFFFHCLVCAVDSPCTVKL